MHDFNAKMEIKIPVSNEIYEKYKKDIKNCQKSDSEKYVPLSGNLEIMVDEFPPF